MFTKLRGNIAKAWNESKLYIATGFLLGAVGGTVLAIANPAAAGGLIAAAELAVLVILFTDGKGV